MVTPSLKPERHHCGDHLYGERSVTIGETTFCTCRKAYQLREPSLWLAITFWRGHTAWVGGVWVRDRKTERRNREASR